LSVRVRWTAVGTVLIVAAVAAVLSYGHLRAVAVRSGEAHGWLFPLSVDGLIVAASLVLLVRRRGGLPGGSLAWGGLALGVAATVAGNIASAEPTAAARVIAAWPPVAFALSYELLLALIRPTAATRPSPTPAGAARPDEDTNRASAPPAHEPPGEARSTGADERDALTERARALLAGSPGRPLGRRALARELGITEHQARTVLDALTADPTAITATNGTSPRAASGRTG